jgi:hypothetical protein
MTVTLSVPQDESLVEALEPYRDAIAQTSSVVESYGFIGDEGGVIDSAGLDL